MNHPWIVGLIAASVSASRAGAQVTGPSGHIDQVALGWIDSTRQEPWTADSTDHRAILVQLFARAGAQEPAPLVLFSTGRNEGPSTYADLAEALASAGYVVAIVDHAGERSGQRFPKGPSLPNLLDHVAPRSTGPDFRIQDSVFNRRWVAMRAADLISARRYLLAAGTDSSTRLFHRLDGRTVSIGHSIGGLTAAKSCALEPALMACVNLDGLAYSLPMHVDGSRSDMAQPFLFVGKPVRALTDEELRRAGMTRAQDEEITARFARRSDELFRSVAGGSYRVIIDGAGHMEFAARGNGRVARAVVAYVLAFLDKQLHDAPRTLLDAPAPEPGVTVTRFGGP
jgi:dienelactone hydrolase